MKTLILLFSVLFTTLSFAQVPSYVPANGLVGWWPFNGNANDESGNGNNGTVSGATLTADRNGVANQAYSFDGVDDYISILRNYQGSFTTSIWFNSNGNSQYKPLIDAFDVNWEIQIMNSFLAYVSFDNSSNLQVFNSSVLITNNNWNNLICTYNSNILNFYLNGTQIDQFTVNTLPINSGNYFLGASQTGSDQYFEGKLDDIGIWNRALTPQEITNLYTSTVPVSCLPAYVPTSGLVGYWPFCGNANDESGNGNNGTVNGATLTTDRNGVANQAYSFDGINDFIVANSNPLYVSDTLTISIWINTNSTPPSISNYTIFELGGTGGSGVRWGCLAEPGNAVMAVGRGCGGVGNAPISTSYNGGWSNFIFVVSGLNHSIYYNGNLIGNSTNSQITSLSCSIANLYFGVSQWSSSYYFTGKLDDIGIWNRALTQQEITNLYTSTVPPTASVLSGDATICLGSSTNLSIAVTGGTAPYTITVTDGTNNYTATGASSVSIPVSPTATSTYTIVSVSGGGTGTGNTGTATVTITPSSTNTTPISACNSYSWNGQTYTQSGVYTGTTASCVTESLNLIITPSSTNTTTASACNSYTWNGTTYTASGVYNGTTENCVTEYLNLTITPSSTNTTTAAACDSYTWNGTTYTATGVYTGTTANCVTQSLNLTITPSSTNTTPISACDSYSWNGQTYTQSGVYTGTTTNCVTQALNLTINTNTSSSISQTALDSYTWPVNNQTYTTTGAYTAVIPNASGCDSTITLNLTMSFTGINDLSASKLSIYPNPTNGDFTITGLELVGTVSSLSLTDMNGKVVKVLDTKATKFSMASIKPGVYFLNIISGNKQEVLKIVKE